MSRNENLFKARLIKFNNQKLIYMEQFMTYMRPFASAGNTVLLWDSCDMAGYFLGYAAAYHNRSY
jgi:hypothetical protein